MKLSNELLSELLSKEDAQIIFPNLNLDAEKTITDSCYCLVKKIKEIISDESLDDTECFYRIEKIVSEFENNEISCGERHDF